MKGDENSLKIGDLETIKYSRLFENKKMKSREPGSIYDWTETTPGTKEVPVEIALTYRQLSILTKN